MAIEVQDYDPAWPAMAADACQELESAMPGLFAALEHIGSTSVPGLAAKPIIDLMVATKDLDDVTAREPELEKLGYQRFETGMSNRLFYRRPATGQATHHLHVVPHDTWDTQNERLLRDHLRSHHDDLERYAALKRQLATSAEDGDAYTRAKTELIQEMMDTARTARGLSPVPVWED